MTQPSTLPELLEQAVRDHGEAAFLRFKRDGAWQTLTYAAFRDQVEALAGCFLREGLQPGDRVALLMANGPEWPAIYFGIVWNGLIAVPVDPQLKAQELRHVLRDAGVRLVVAEVRAYPVLRELEDDLPTMETVLLQGGAEILPVPKSRCSYRDLDVTLHVRDADKPPAPQAPAPDDVASLIYTSGTTGRPKGAMLTHANFVANALSCEQCAVIATGDQFLLVLPLHHAFAFTTNLLLPMACGSQVGLVEHIRTIGENLLELSPSILIGVPLLVEKMYERMQARLKANRLAGFLLKAGAGRLVTRKLKARLGGQLRMVITGGAPCPLHILRGFQRLGLPILEGYGLTEAGPVLTLNPPGAPKPGTVGRALPGVELRLLKPDIHGVGQVVARGANIMKGYFGDPDASAAAFDDGWLLTGDLGILDDEGYLTLTGRKKSLIVNREGKNIYPEEVQQVLLRSPCILEALVLGYRDRSGSQAGEKVGAIVVPDFEALREKHHHLDEPELSQLLKAEVKRISSELAVYKRPRRIRIRTEEFLKTSTGKVKRYLYRLDDEEVD